MGGRSSSVPDEHTVIPVFRLVLPLLLATAPASAEIFKCVAKNGLPLYQNFPCAMDSLGLSSPSPAKAAPTSATRVDSRTSAQASEVKLETKRSTVAAVHAQTQVAEPRLGMTPAEVTAIWGEPTQVVQDEPPSGRVEIWEYGDGKSVHFNASKQRVLSVQR
jgi:hypothetical protein